MSTQEPQESGAAQVAPIAVEWVYMGRRIGNKGKVAYAWLADEGFADARERWFAKQLVPGAVVGGVYLIHRDDKTIIIAGPNSPRYVRRHDDKSVAEWARDDELVKVRKSAESAERDARSDTSYFGSLTLDQARSWFMRRRTSADRAGALALIIKYITYGV